jgi:hypothetical protein
MHPLPSVLPGRCQEPVIDDAQRISCDCYLCRDLDVRSGRFGIVPSYTLPQQMLDIVGYANTLIKLGITISTMNYCGRSHFHFMGLFSLNS